ncbi:class I SAM-dependent methyltransferase [Streptomyces rugosispiralis]|uniref:class I SAM-dependent methyltransferase n=1 Tax=Streptomyces rugosispiralis TaxID=2967341 RepID=UPI003703844E
MADVGCGPGHVTAHLNELGVDAFGIDLSSVMIDVARRDHPRLRFEVGSMTDLDLADASVVGLLAFWSLIHVPDEAVPTVFGHLRRVLRPGGLRGQAGRALCRDLSAAGRRGVHRRPARQAPHLAGPLRAGVGGGYDGRGGDRQEARRAVDQGLLAGGRSRRSPRAWWPVPGPRTPQEEAAAAPA